MSLTPEQLNQIQIWRRKQADGTLTIEEMQQAVLMMREHRISAQSAPRAVSKSKSKVVDLQDLESQIDNL